MNKNFNMIIAGVGGQGLITLTKIIAEAALIEKRDVKTSELHGLSQKGGSVETCIRFGEKIYSPLISKSSADLVLSLEIVEGLRKVHYAKKETVFLINGYSLPYEGRPPASEVEKMMGQIKNRKYIIPASKICQEELGKEVLSGIYLLGFALGNSIIPLKAGSIEKAFKDLVPKKYLDLNIKAFRLGKSSKHAD